MFPDLTKYGKEWPLGKPWPQDSWPVHHWIRLDAENTSLTCESMGRHTDYMVEWLKSYLAENGDCELIHREMIFKPPGAMDKYCSLGIRLQVWFKDEIVTDPPAELPTKKNKQASKS